MNDHRDDGLGDAVNRIPVPPRDGDFMPKLLARLESIDAGGKTQAGSRGGRAGPPLAAARSSQRQRHRCSRPHRGAPARADAERCSRHPQHRAAAGNGR